jgi:hypothetical protein
LKDYVASGFHLGANIKKAWSENVPQARDEKEHSGEQEQPHR